MKKKVCMIVPSFTAKGGIAAVVRGYRGSVLEENYNIKYIETYCDGNKFFKILKALTAYLTFLYELLFRRPDLVHIHSSFGGSFFRKLPFVYLSSIFKIPIINHIHGSELERLYVNAGSFKKSLVEKTFDKCTYIVVLSQEWVCKLNVIKSNTPKEVIKNYSVLHPDAVKKKEKESLTILYLGFITQLKGCFDMPDIIKQTTEKYPQVHFILGGVGETEKLQKQLCQMNLDRFVSLPGWIDSEQKDFFFRQADLFLLPSYTEAMPMSILEAMGYGLPVVSTNVGGIPQLVQERVNGFLLKPGDKAGMAHAILELLKNKELRYSMGKESFKIANDTYSLEKHVKKIQTLYKKCLEE